MSIGYYVLGAVAAFDGVPVMLEKHAALLGQSPAAVFRRVTFPLARLGLAVALSVAWVRALGEFGAVMVTAYYPSGMPVQLLDQLAEFWAAGGDAAAADLSGNGAAPCPGRSICWRNAGRMLEAHIVKRRRDFTVDVRLELEPGRCFALFGASGSGKSTVLSCIAGIEQPDDGFVRWDGVSFYPPALPLHLRQRDI